MSIPHFFLYKSINIKINYYYSVPKENMYKLIFLLIKMNIEVDYNNVVYTGFTPDDARIDYALCPLEEPDTDLTWEMTS